MDVFHKVICVPPPISLVLHLTVDFQVDSRTNAVECEGETKQTLH